MPVPTGHPLFGKAIMCKCLNDIRADRQAKALRNASGLSDETIRRFLIQDFDVDACRVGQGVDEKEMRRIMRDVHERCSAYSRDPRGWLVMVGPVGCGKTHLAYGIAGACLREDIPVFAGTSADILSSLRARYDKGDFDTIFEQVRNVGVLVIDDLGAERATEWAKEKLFQLINWRYQNALPLVVTSNLHPSTREAQDRIDGRLLSRLQDKAISTMLVLPAGDYRRGTKSAQKQVW